MIAIIVLTVTAISVSPAAVAQNMTGDSGGQSEIIECWVTHVALVTRELPVVSPEIW